MIDRGSALPMTLVVAGILWTSPAMAAHKDWKSVADVGVVGLESFALGRAAYEQDWKGVKQFGLTLGVTAGATAGLKSAFPEMRPDRSDDRSFPSGHTSSSFAAAAFLQRRYGWQWGLPATLVAGVVGLARIESKDHHWYDVVAGAALGEASAYLFTTPHDTDVQFLPWADSHGAGFTMAKRF